MNSYYNNAWELYKEQKFIEYYTGKVVKYENGKYTVIGEHESEYSINQNGESMQAQVDIDE